MRVSGVREIDFKNSPKVSELIEQVCQRLDKAPLKELMAKYESTDNNLPWELNMIMTSKKRPIHLQKERMWRTKIRHYMAIDELLMLNGWDNPYEYIKAKRPKLNGVRKISEKYQIGRATLRYQIDRFLKEEGRKLAWSLTSEEIKVESK